MYGNVADFATLSDLLCYRLTVPYSHRTRADWLYALGQRLTSVLGFPLVRSSSFLVEVRSQC